VPVTLNVTGPEKLTVPAGTFDCYKVELNIGQTFWFSSDASRYLIKLEAGGVIASLTGISHHTPGEKAAYSDASAGFSVTAPAGWLFYRWETEEKGLINVGVLDPKAWAASSLVVRALTSLKPEETNSLRAYASHLLAESAKMEKNFKIRDDSWTNQTVAGQPALSVLSDYTEGETAKVTSTICSFIGANAVSFQTTATAKDLEALQSKWNSVVNSFQTQ